MANAIPIPELPVLVPELDCTPCLDRTKIEIHAILPQLSSKLSESKLESVESEFGEYDQISFALKEIATNLNIVMIIKRPTTLKGMLSQLKDSFSNFKQKQKQKQKRPIDAIILPIINDEIQSLLIELQQQLK